MRVSAAIKKTFFAGNTGRIKFGVLLNESVVPSGQKDDKFFFNAPRQDGLQERFGPRRHVLIGSKKKGTNLFFESLVAST
jgi:hypothetical protein